MMHLENITLSTLKIGRSMRKWSLILLSALCLSAQAQLDERLVESTNAAAAEHFSAMGLKSEQAWGHAFSSCADLDECDLEVEFYIKAQNQAYRYTTHECFGLIEVTESKSAVFFIECEQL